MTVKRIGSVKTPRNVDVAFYYEDVVRGFSREATSEVARLRSSRAVSVSVSIVNEFTEVRIRRSDVANACRLRFFCPAHLSVALCTIVMQEDAAKKPHATITQ